MPRMMMGSLSLLVLVGCAGVPKPGVQDATTAIATQVELAKASLAKCREGRLRATIEWPEQRARLPGSTAPRASV